MAWGRRQQAAAAGTQAPAGAAGRPGSSGAPGGGAGTAAAPAPGLPLAAGLAVVFLLALNLRTAVVAVPPLLGPIRHSLGLSASVGGLLTTVPTLCFGVFAVAAPAVGGRVGLEPAVAAGLALMVAGQALRLAPGAAALFAGTLIAGIGAALGNVLLPALVKRDFPRHVGLLTGVYMLALTGGATLAAGAAVPLDHALGGWRPSLAVWAAPAAVGFVAMSALARGRHSRSTTGPRVHIASLRRQPIAWMLTLGMATQAFLYYSLITWLPTVFEQHGISPGEAGWLLALNGVVGLPAALAAPVLAGRLADQRPLVLVSSGLLAVGLLGLVLAPRAAPALWSILLGIGTSIAFALVVTQFGLRSADAAVASGVSAMAQSYGYLLACTGPFLVGYLHDALGSWSAALLLLLAMVVPQCLAGLGASRPGSVIRVVHAPGSGAPGAGVRAGGSAR